jgi:hypothetical protein
MHARALAVMAGSVLAIGLAGIAYLHPSAAGRTIWMVSTRAHL